MNFVYLLFIAFLLCSPCIYIAEAELLFNEDFKDDSLTQRGWFGGITGSGYSVVYDSLLGKNVLHGQWEVGRTSPASSARLNFEAQDEITLKYKIRMSPNWEWTVGHHMIMTHSSRDVDEGNGSPANAFGSTYFEWNWYEAGIFIGKFQDNRAINCTYGFQDLTDVTEERSVGGYQTFFAPEGQRTSKWGDPCENGLDAYTGQSVLTCYANGADHPMTKNEWWDLILYLKKNSIVQGKGIWDGHFDVWWQGPGDPAPVLVMDHDSVLWRAGGSNKDLKWKQLMIAPYLHDGANEEVWFRIADIEIHRGKAVAAESLKAVLPRINILNGFPNPARSRINIHYSVKSPGTVQIRIFNQQGRLVRTLLDQNRPAGNFSIIWNGHDRNDTKLASGIYLCCMRTGSGIFKRKIVLVR
jgi:hypothetical protein